MGTGQQPLLVNIFERPELRLRAAEPDLRGGGGGDVVDRDQTSGPPMFRRHHDMGDRARHRIDDHPLELPAVAVAASDAASDDEIRRFAQDLSLSR